MWAGATGFHMNRISAAGMQGRCSSSPRYAATTSPLFRMGRLGSRVFLCAVETMRLFVHVSRWMSIAVSTQSMGLAKVCPEACEPAKSRPTGFSGDSLVQITEPESPAMLN